MKADQQRIKIAEVCRWTDIAVAGAGEDRTTPATYGRLCGVNPSFLPAVFYHVVPDYLNDLNSMREAAFSIPKSQITQYHTLLMSICGGLSDAIEANAEKRAEALLKTLDLWEEEYQCYPFRIHYLNCDPIQLKLEADTEREVFDYLGSLEWRDYAVTAMRGDQPKSWNGKAWMESNAGRFQA